jgi:endonuclease/exonuclease/phosphatase family metal-dependent hydrolase
MLGIGVCRLAALGRNLLVLVPIVIVGACLVFFLQPFGHHAWTFAAILALLAAIASPRSPARRLAPLARAGCVGVLACWLCLIAWASTAPGGPLPAPKADAASIRVVTWNILLGTDAGPSWLGHDWPVRKHALRTTLRAAAPDILCVQEALPGQVAFLETMLPRHQRVGVGRDDGRSAGEHCAIYFDAGRFEPLGGATLWLEEPTDLPPSGPRLGPKRICTWVRLHDRHSGRCLRVYNVHLYLTEAARLRAARIIVGQIASGDPTDALVVAGDFNAAPGVPSRQRFAAAGLRSVLGRTGGKTRPCTYQFYGIRTKCIDDILLSGAWQVQSHRVIDAKPANTFPSDHFGVLADLAFEPLIAFP